MTTTKQNRTAKTTFWGTAIFYILVAFEFAYMAGPFAAYFYSIYSPALNFFNQSPALAWLVGFFLPHAVRETSSTIINIHNILGAILAVLGFSVFCIGACQIYYHKLARKGAVTGGIYNFIRHPQYTSFIVCSFGLLILWPRYIVLVMFITMLFAYYLLAKAEERECEVKFGQTYIDYKKRTGMFLPFKLSTTKKIPSLPKSKSKKFLAILGIYIVTLAIALSIAKGVNYLAINSLYASYTVNSANIALCKIESSKLEQIMDIALANEEVKTRLEETEKGNATKFLNYILPTEWYAAEIPMNGVKYRAGHRSPSAYDNNLYKVIFTQADLRSNSNVAGKDILLNVTKRHPIVEVWINVSDHKVIKIMEMPEEIKYQSTPVALY